LNYNWIYLSHQLNKNLFAYGNGDGIAIKQTNSIINGDTSNNTHLSLPAHFGTHIDYPYHFDNNGFHGDDFTPESFISKKVQVIDKSNSNNTAKYFEIKDFNGIKFNPKTEILIIKTGMGAYLLKDIYWNDNPGFEPELASFFKSKMSNLRIFGFDAISLTARNYREKGKLAHREFLINNHILILEDMNLSQLHEGSKIDQIIISPLRFEKADGAPVTIFAKVLSK